MCPVARGRADAQRAASRFNAADAPPDQPSPLPHLALTSNPTPSSVTVRARPARSAFNCTSTSTASLCLAALTNAS